MKTIVKLMLLVVLLTLLLGLTVEANEPWEEIDLEGETVTISFVKAWHSGFTPFGTRHEYSWLEPDERVQAHIEDIEEKFNCNIEIKNVARDIWSFEETGQYVLEEVLSGDPSFDIIIVGMQVWPRLALEGALLPLDDYIPDLFWKSVARSEDSKVIEEAKKPYMVQGKLYSFPLSVGEPGKGAGGAGVTFDKNVFAEKDLPSPYDLFENDEWNFEKFLEIARQLPRDTTEDGEIDQYAIRVPDVESLAAKLVVMNGVEPVVTKDGKRVVNLDHPRAIEVLEFIQTLFQEGLATTGYGESDMQFFGLGRLGYDRYQEEGEDWGYVPLPKGPSAEKNVSLGSDRVHGPVLPFMVENPREKLEVYWALRQSYLPYWDMEMEDLKELEWGEGILEIVHDRKSLEMAEYAENNRANTIDVSILVPAGLEEVMDEIMFEGRDVSSVISEYKPQLQTAVDEFYEQ